MANYTTNLDLERERKSTITVALKQSTPTGGGGGGVGSRVTKQTKIERKNATGRPKRVRINRSIDLVSGSSQLRLLACLPPSTRFRTARGAVVGDPARGDPGVVIQGSMTIMAVSV
uniref:Uncharacterized protein n=1 Tax=Physcomitrium patens TaxID=3218 RepID=A0A2K1IHI8_PHYPA|nr:hypothetical protein PHYPA_029340 [Physcomitrium patens]